MNEIAGLEPGPPNCRPCSQEYNPCVVEHVEQRSCSYVSFQVVNERGLVWTEEAGHDSKAITSANAYMLVYRRRAWQPPASANGYNVPQE